MVMDDATNDNGNDNDGILCIPDELKFAAHHFYYGDALLELQALICPHMCTMMHA